MDAYVLDDIGGHGLDELRSRFPGAVEALADEVAESGAYEPGDALFTADEFMVGADGRLRHRTPTDPPGEGPPERVWDGKGWVLP